MKVHARLYAILVVVVCGCCGQEENISSTTETTDITTKKVFTWHRKVTTVAPTMVSTVNLRMATPCITPNGENAYCTEIQKCPELLTHQLKYKTDHFLRESRCGPSNEDSNMPKVCCGKHSNYYKTKAQEKNEDPLPKKCGHQSISLKGRILGGQEATLGEYPWLVRLIHRNSLGYKSFGCSGFLITSKYVLTAAHCVDSPHLDQIGPVSEILLGEHNVETEEDCEQISKTKIKCADEPQKIRVAETIVHPRYDKNLIHHHNDIALIHMRKVARFSDYVYPICLEHNVDQSVEYWISGWGKTETRAVAPNKMKLSLPEFPWKDCEMKYKTIDIKIKHTQICAGGLKGKDSCTGDSGGPLMVYKNETWYAAGVVSYGLGCGQEGWPGVYTNIEKYTRWIKNEIRKKSTSATATPRGPKRNRKH